MKFLILTCNTGGGHHATAAALSDYFTSHRHQCVTMECLDFLHPAKAKLVSEGHILLYRRAPRLFGMGYRFEENHSNQFIVRQFKRCAEAFYHAAMQTGCDAILCTHAFSALVVTAARKQFSLSIPSFFVATDYTCSPCVADSKLDAYFIPHESLKDEFVRRGVPAHKLAATGIPVRAAFYNKIPQALARQKLGLPDTGKLVLLACGSMGAGPLEELTVLLDRTLSPEDHLVVVCGTNERLQRKLERSKLSDSVRVVGFTREMDLYMDAADVMLTKPGGLTTTEALMKRLPVVYIDAVPGCETRNLNFMVARNYAVTAKTTWELAAVTCELLHNEERLTSWRQTMERDFPDCAVESLYTQVLSRTNAS